MSRSSNSTAGPSGGIKCDSVHVKFRDGLEWSVLSASRGVVSRENRVFGGLHAPESPCSCYSCVPCGDVYCAVYLGRVYFSVRGLYCKTRF